MLSDDTDIFFLLVYWLYKMRIKATIQMGNWEGRVLCVKSTCKYLGANCLQLLDLHYLTGSDVISYLCGKGKISALTTFLKDDFP